MLPHKDVLLKLNLQIIDGCWVSPSGGHRDRPVGQGLFKTKPVVFRWYLGNITTCKLH